jgi:hypothetical protein
MDKEEDEELQGRGKCEHHIDMKDRGTFTIVERIAQSRYAVGDPLLIKM